MRKAFLDLPAALGVASGTMRSVLRELGYQGQVALVLDAVGRANGIAVRSDAPPEVLQAIRLMGNVMIHTLSSEEMCGLLRAGKQVDVGFGDEPDARKETDRCLN
jgi:hypothetical protein